MRIERPRKSANYRRQITAGNPEHQMTGLESVLQMALYVCDVDCRRARFVSRYRSNDSVLLIHIAVCWRVSVRRVREQNLVEEYMLPCKARSSLLLERFNINLNTLKDSEGNEVNIA